MYRCGHQVFMSPSSLMEWLRLCQRDLLQTVGVVWRLYPDCGKKVDVMGGILQTHDSKHVTWQMYQTRVRPWLHEATVSR